MDNKHTPGPWRICPADDYVPERFNVIGNGPYGDVMLAEEIDIHDARLIAAAPDLLDALKALTENPRPADETGNYGKKYQRYSDAFDAARSAIAKAVG